MNKANTPRVLASISAITTVIAAVSLSVAMFSSSVTLAVDLVALGLLAAFVHTRVDRHRVNEALNNHIESIQARDEALHARIFQIVTWWQADIQAIANGTPRPDPTAVLRDQPPSPRRGDEELEREEQLP